MKPLNFKRKTIVAGSGSYRPHQPFKQEREAFTIPLQRGTMWVELSSGR